MTTWYTSDTHFSHKNIIKYSNRPFKDYSHMNEVIVNNWNSVVMPDDVVYHLGDVALGPIDTWDNILSRLNGRKILVVGNHERIFADNKAAYIERFRPTYEKWFDEIYDNIAEHELSNGMIVNLSHFPYDGDSHDEDRYTAYRLVDDGTVLIHGHTHAEFGRYGDDARRSLSTAGTLQIHVGMDAWQYSPVSESTIIEYIED